MLRSKWDGEWGEGEGVSVGVVLAGQEARRSVRAKRCSVAFGGRRARQKGLAFNVTRGVLEMTGKSYGSEGAADQNESPRKSNAKFRQCPFLEVPRWPKRNDPFTEPYDISSITDAIIPTPAVMAAVPLLLSHALFMSRGLLPSAPPPVSLHFALAPFLIHASRHTGRCFQHAESHPAGTALGWPSANSLHG